MVNDVHHSVEAVSGENFALYIEGQRCPFSYIQRTRGARGVSAGLTCVIPAVEILGSSAGEGKAVFSPKDIPARSKVVLLWRNQFASSDAPRYVVLFEGEIANQGFIRTPDQKNYQFYAKHILSHLDGIAIMALEPNAFLEQVVEGKSEEGNTLEMTITGSIIEKFKPSFVAGALNPPVNVKKLDIYSFVRGALAMYLNEGSQSVAKEAWPLKAAVEYGFLDRMHVKGANANIKWENMYYLIMQYTFLNMIPKIGGANITFLQLISFVAQMFLHDIDLMPDPPNYSAGLVVKPENLFNEPPTCNVIYPIMLTSIPYIEPWDSKPTRLIQITQPSTGISDLTLRKYLRTVSPPVLRQLFKDYQDASAEDKKKMNLVTEEEKKRGIITAYNEIPAFLSAAIEVVKDGGVNPQGGTGKKPIDNASSPVSGGEENDASINYTDGLLIDISVYSTVYHKKVAHEILFNLESGRDWKDKGTTTQDEYKKGSVVGAKPGTPQMKPSRIYIVPAEWKFHSSDATYNYVVDDNGVVEVKRGRNFHIFEECTWAIPLGIKFNIDKIPNKVYTFTPLTKDIAGVLTSPLIDPLNGGGLVPQHAIDQKCVSGGTQSSIAIKIGKTDKSWNKAAKLVAAISYLAGLSIASDVKGLYDEFGDRFPTASGTENDNNSVYKTRVNEIKRLASQNMVDMKDYAGSEWKKFGDAHKDIKKAVDLTATGKKAKPGTETPKNPEVAQGNKNQNTVILLSATAEKAVEEKINQAMTKSAFNNPNEAARAIARRPGEDPSKIAITSIIRGLAKIKTMSNKPDDLNALACFLVDSVVAQYGSSKEAFAKAFGKEYKAFYNFCLVINKLTDTTGSVITPSVSNLLVSLGSFVVVFAAGTQGGSGASNLFLNRVKQAFKTETSEVGIIANIRSFYDNGSEDIFALLLEFIKYYRYLYAEIAQDGTERDGAIAKAFNGGKGTLVKWVGLTNAPFTGRPQPKKSTKDQKDDPQTAQPNPTKEGAPESPPSNSDPNAKPETPTTKVDEVKWQQLQAQYIEPICDYYFYKLRHESSIATLDMEFNPFITPGYSSMILDADDKLSYPSHLKGFVVSVADTITPESITTQVQMSHIRRVDESTYQEMLATGIPQLVDKVTGKVKPLYLGPLDLVQQHAPFFGGEWAHTWEPTKNIWGLDTTYKNHLGSSLYEGSKNTKGEDTTYSGAPSYADAMKKISRNIQHIQFNGAPNATTPDGTNWKTIYDKIYSENPSLVEGDWNNGDFPLAIKSFTTGTSLNYMKEGIKPQTSLKPLTEIAWNQDVADYINKLNDVVKHNRAT